MLNNKMKNTFMKYITGFWLLSMVAEDMRIVRRRVAPITNGRIATPLPYMGMEKGRLNTTSGLERSDIHKIKGAPRNSIVDRKTTNSAQRRGI